MILPVNILKAFDNIDGIGNVHLIDCNRYIISIGILPVNILKAFDNIDGIGNVHHWHFELFSKTKVAIGFQLFFSENIVRLFGAEEHRGRLLSGFGAWRAMQALLVVAQSRQLDAVISHRHDGAGWTAALFPRSLLSFPSQPLFLQSSLLLFHGVVGASDRQHLHHHALRNFVFLRHKFVGVTEVAEQFSRMFIQRRRRQFLGTAAALYAMFVERAAIGRHVRLGREHRPRAGRAHRRRVGCSPRHRCCSSIAK